MIDIIKTPQEDSVTFNSSPIEINIRSTRGANHYFTMQIFVDGELYDTQQRSKIDDFNCFVNFQNQVQDVFNIPATQVEITGVVLQSNLTKRISIKFHEYEQGTNAFVDSLDIPDFYLINSNNSINKKIEDLTALSLYQDKISIPLLGLVNFPYYANGEHTIKLFKNDTEIWTETVNNGFGMFNFQLRSIQFNFRKNDTAYFTITKDSIIIRRDFNFPLANGYIENAILIQNNHNAFEYFYCFGDKEEKPNYKSYALKLDNEIERRYKTDERVDYKLNTGYFSKDYLDPIQNLPKSLLLYLIEGSELIEVRITNKSRTEDKQRKFLFNYTLLLTKNQLDDVGANVLYFNAPTAVNIISESVAEETVDLSKQVFFDSLNRGTPISIVFGEYDTSKSIIINYNGVDESIVVGKVYDYNNISMLRLTNTKQGTPFLEIPFYIETTQGKTNTARIIYNIDFNDVLEAAPIISVADCVTVFSDEPSKTIFALVTEPNGQDFTIQWAQVGGGTINITQTDRPTLLTSGWAGPGEYEFEITAIDIRGNQTKRRTILKVMSYEVQLALGENKIKVYGGKAGDQVTLRHTFVSSPILDFTGTTSQYTSLPGVSIDGGEHKFVNVNLPGPNDTLTRSDPFDRVHIFPASGEFELPYTSDNFVLGREIKVCIISVTGVQTIGKNECLFFND